MSYQNIKAILEEGGDISVGLGGSIKNGASASNSYNCPVMLVRREGETFAHEELFDWKLSVMLLSIHVGSSTVAAI